MTLEEFVKDNLNFITDEDTVAVVSYTRDAHYEKTLFGIKPALDYTGKPSELYYTPNVKAQLKADKIRFRRGQHFVARSVGYHSFEIVRGIGIVLGNYSAKSGDAVELQYILDQPKVRALVWYNEKQERTIYYEKTAAASTDVSGV